MGLFAWKQGFVPDAETAAQRVAAGAAYLDRQFGTEWEQLIDVERLDIGSITWCMLAQLGRAGKMTWIGPWRCMRYGFSIGLLTDTLAVCGYRSPEAARSYVLLDDAWKALIGQRRRAAQRVYPWMRLVRPAAISARVTGTAPPVRGSGPWTPRRRPAEPVLFGNN